MKKFIESEHPRDKEGKFTKKNSKNAKDNNSGAMSGALNPLDEKDYEKTQAHAKLMYSEIMKRKTDFKKVAKISNITETEAKEIKEYVFSNLEFVPDFDQAESWRRLSEGKPIEEDFLFIKHELYEISLRKEGMDYIDAHNLTNELYDYGKAMREYYNGKTNKKRS